MKAEPAVGLLALHDKRGWMAVAIVALVLCVLVPLLSLAVPVSSALHLPDYLVALLGKFLCYGIVALAIDLIWGFTGILSLGHGVFFALGGYAMGMYLMLSIGAQGVYKSALPDFMVFLDWKELPWFWRGFDNLSVALFAALVGGMLRSMTGLEPSPSQMLTEINSAFTPCFFSKPFSWTIQMVALDAPPAQATRSFSCAFTQLTDAEATNTRARPSTKIVDGRVITRMLRRRDFPAKLLPVTFRKAF